MTVHDTRRLGWRAQLLAGALAFLGVAVPARIAWQQLRGSAGTLTRSEFGSWAMVVGAVAALVLLAGLALPLGRRVIFGLLVGLLLSGLAIGLAILRDAVSAGA